MRPNCFSDSFELIGNQCARVTSSFYYANWATSAQHKSFLRVIDRNGDFNACSNMTQFFQQHCWTTWVILLFYMLTLYIYISTTTSVYCIIGNFMENQKDSLLKIKFKIVVSKTSYVIRLYAQDHEWHFQNTFINSWLPTQ